MLHINIFCWNIFTNSGRFAKFAKLKIHKECSPIQYWHQCCVLHDGVMSYDVLCHHPYDGSCCMYHQHHPRKALAWHNTTRPPQSARYVCVAKLTVDLVPRLSRFRMWTLKLCRCGEPGIFFFHVSSVKGGETLIVYGRTRKLWTEKKVKVAGNLLHTSSYQGENAIQTERRTDSWLNIAQNVVCSKNSGLFSIMSCSHDKRYQALPMYTY